MRVLVAVFMLFAACSSGKMSNEQTTWFAGSLLTRPTTLAASRCGFLFFSFSFGACQIDEMDPDVFPSLCVQDIHFNPCLYGCWTSPYNWRRGMPCDEREYHQHRCQVSFLYPLSPGFSVDATFLQWQTTFGRAFVMGFGLVILALLAR